MLSKLLLAGLLMALCLVIDAIGLTAAIRWLRSRPVPVRQGFWPVTATLVAVAGWTVLMHLFEITGWALCFAWSSEPRPRATR